MTFVARAYALTVLAAASWAWWTEISMVGRNVEHLLPGIVFALLTLPSSLLMDPLFEAAPALLSSPFVQLAVLTLLALLQVIGVWRLAGWLSEGGRA